MERTLYNGLISGLSLDGEHFFYPNALESDGVYKFNRGECSRQSWFDCSCCPSNLIRFLPAVQGLIYAQKKQNVYVNLYVGSQASLQVDNKPVQLRQTTRYPWDGKVQVEVQAGQGVDMQLKLRVPGWMQGAVLPSDLYHYVHASDAIPKVSVDGKEIPYAAKDGYITIDGPWKNNTLIELDFPMDVHMVQAIEEVVEDRGKVSLEYGPVVYAVESTDNPNGFDDLKIQKEEAFQIHWTPGLLQGVNVLEGVSPTGSFKAIPYYAWSNRGIAKMKVWLPAEMNEY